jgi:hypothetical protein
MAREKATVPAICIAIANLPARDTGVVTVHARVVDAVVAVVVDAAVNVPKVLQELLVQRKNSTG